MSDSSEIKRFGRQIVNAVSSRMLQLTLSLGTLAISARWLGPTGRGYAITAHTWALLLGSVGAMSLGQVVMSRASNNPKSGWFRTHFGVLVFASLVTSLMIGAPIVVIYKFDLWNPFLPCSWDFVFVILLFLPFFIWDQYQYGLFCALDRLQNYNRIHLFGRALMITSVALLSIRESSPILFLLVLVVVQAGVSGWGCYQLWSTNGRPQLVIKVDILIEMLTAGIRLHLDTISTFVLLYADVLIISRVWGPELAGLYQLALQLVMLGLIVSSSASAVAYGKLGTLGLKLAWKFQRVLVFWSCLIMVVLCFFGYFAAPFLVAIVGGNSFNDAIPIYRILVFSLIGINMSTIMATVWISHQRFLTLALITTGLAIAKMGLVVVWVPSYGAIGAAWATVLIFSLSFIIHSAFALTCERRS